jgi:hypothetical protein
MTVISQLACKDINYYGFMTKWQCLIFAFCFNHNENLFVCDGTSGLKVFDITNPLQLQTVATFSNVQATDVIPSEDVFLMIGDYTLYQYSYVDGSIQLISTYNL